MSLSRKLKEGTKESHNIVENTKFIISFLNGVVDKNKYKKLLSNFYFIYSALEEEIEKNKDNFLLKFLYYPELNRKLSLEQDLKYFYGDNFRSYISPSPYTKLYVNRIKTLSEDFPELLVAHHYTRYLGDLSGGQILKNIVKRSLNLKDDNGLSFYIFSNVNHVGEFKVRYKKSLDEMPIDDGMTKKIIGESNYAFHLNMNIFQEFEGNLLKNLIQKIFRIS
jgi:heme oxygenase (biliverdin-producing, ferredoxin)